MSPKSSKPKQSARDVMEALRKRYPAPAFAMFQEVGNSTGGRCRRHADAVAMGLWPSRGLEVIGVEIKVSRADWKKELSDPEKADELQKYCHRWWVASANDAVPLAEVPPNWGMLELNGRGLRVAKEAPFLQPTLDLGFVAALVRKVHASAMKREQRIRLEGILEGEQRGPAQHREELSVAHRKIEALEKAISSFEERSGIAINQWDAGRMGDVVKRLLSLRTLPDPCAEYENLARRLDHHVEDLKRRSDECREFVAAIRNAGIGGAR